MNTQLVTVEAVNIKDRKEFTYKSGARKGQQGFLYPIGLNVGGKWINGTAFSDDEADVFRKLNKGDKISLVLFNEEYQGKTYEKFKLPNDKDRLEARLEELERKVAKLEQHLNAKAQPEKPKPMPELNIDSRYDNNDLPF